jgi:hypothetical protein
VEVGCHLWQRENGDTYKKEKVEINIIAVKGGNEGK